MSESAESRAADAWNTRDLAAVLIAAAGAWQCVSWSLALLEALRVGPFGEGSSVVVLFHGGYAAIGAGLFAFAPRLAGRLFPAPRTGPAPDDLVDLLAAALAVVGVVVALSRIDELARVLLPFATYGVADDIPLRNFVIDAVTAAVGIVLFLKSGAVARRWQAWTARR